MVRSSSRANNGNFNTRQTTARMRLSLAPAINFAFAPVPSLIFGLLCAFFLPEDFAEFLDLGSVGTLVASGFLGAGTTLTAFIITMIATLQARTTRKTRIALWTLVVSSLACWLYIWICFSAVHQVPPHIPMKM